MAKRLDMQFCLSRGAPPPFPSVTTVGALSTRLHSRPLTGPEIPRNLLPCDRALLEGDGGVPGHAFLQSREKRRHRGEGVSPPPLSSLPRPPTSPMWTCINSLAPRSSPWEGYQPRDEALTECISRVVAARERERERCSETLVESNKQEKKLSGIKHVKLKMPIF